MYIGKQDSAVLRTHDKRIERLERRSSFGPPLGSHDLARPGWQDDFVGKVLDPRYTTQVVAGGAVALRDGEHGGVVRLSVPNAAGASARLFLGDGAAGFSTACISYEWFFAVRMKISALNVGASIVGATEFGTNNVYWGGYAPAVSPNWTLYSRDNGGAASLTSSAIAVDTGWHTLVFRSRITFVELWLDGSLICTHSTNMPTGCMEPYMLNDRTAGALNLDIDWIRIFWR